MSARHILIIDDEPIAETFLTETLERSNWECRLSVAHSRQEALGVLEGSSIDLLIADIRMPGIGGLELIGRVRTSSLVPRTVLIAAYGDNPTEAEAHRLEAYRIITEPLNVIDFTWVMQQALRDIAVSRPGLVVLSDESFMAITRQLEYLCRDIGAQCVVLADMSGLRLSMVGATTGINITNLLPDLVGGFATVDAVAREIGDGQAIHFNYNAGFRYEVYTATVGDNLFLTMVYDLQIQVSRIGIVRLRTLRAVDRLLSRLSTAGTATTAQPPDTGFGSSLRAELDTLFKEESLSHTSLGEEEQSSSDHQPQVGGDTRLDHSSLANQLRHSIVTP